MEIDECILVVCSCGCSDFSFYPEHITKISEQHLQARMQCMNCNKVWIQETKLTEYQEPSNVTQTST